MNTKPRPRTRINIVTLGCAKNTVDSEKLLTQLKGNRIRAGHELDLEESQIVIINTCGFIETAKQESIDTILRYVEAKQQGNIEKVYVMGCLAQRYRDNLQAEIPEVDAWFGTRDLKLLLNRLRANYKHELVGERVLTTPSHFAYLKISEGCNRPCSFCAIPLMRGRYVSRPIDELVREARHLTAQGVKELLLIAQDSTYYGIDVYRKPALAELLARLAEIESLEWIRLHYAFPAGFPLEILSVMAQNPNICNYLDMPLQHSSTRMLKLMRRGMTYEKTTRLLETIRAKVPGVAIRTTLMVGHPGETEKDFQHLMRFVEQNRFARLGAFSYSHEENTTAGAMSDDVPPSVKQERMEELMALQQAISSSENATKIGKTFKTLIDRREGNKFIGRTEFDSPEVDNEVIVEASPEKLRTGHFAQIKIRTATEFDLIGDPVQ